MSTPRFVQIAVSANKYGHRLYALDENGCAWRYDHFRPDHSPDGTPYKWCWEPLAMQTYAEAWPTPKPDLSDCLIQPPTLEDEARDEVERLLA